MPNNAPVLDNATRRILKATYVPLKVDTPTALEGGAVLKFGYVLNLSLQQGEVDLMHQGLSAFAGLGNDRLTFINDPSLWSTLRSFEGSPMPSQLPSRNVFANTSPATLLAFGKAVVGLRQQALGQLKQLATAAPAALSSERAPAISRPMSPTLPTDQAKSLFSLNTGIVATKNFEQNISATPIGWLNLERLEMTPAGIERGELLATIPLAPQEKTAVVQKEWSVTSQEFTSIVTDSLENYSETGVTENTELAQSTASQIQHSNQFNINATVSGGIGFVSGSVSTSFGSQDSNSQSATDSRKHAVATTRKASARVKQEHKTTISTTTVTGTSETTTRVLENPSTTDPIRIDYFSLMRKWRVALYRYGLRLTYDISIPEPGGTLRELYMQLDTLQKQAAKGFTFPLTYADITPQTYEDTSSLLWFYANQWGTPPPPPPSPTQTNTYGGTIPNLVGDNDTNLIFNQLEFDVPEGYAITDVSLSIILSNLAIGRGIHIVGMTGSVDLAPNEWEKTFDLVFMHGYTGHQIFAYTIVLVSCLANIWSEREGLSLAKRRVP